MAADETYEPAIPAGVIQLGVCIDLSESNNISAAEIALDQVASVVGDAAADASLEDGTDPAAGIDLVVRRISARSFSEVADELARESVPAIPGLLPAPDPAEYQTFAARNEEWRAARASVEAAMSAAAAGRDAIDAALAQLDLSTTDGSEIAGCMTAIRDSFPSGSDIVIVVASDMEQTGTPNIRGDYTGVDLIVAHTCETAAVCNEVQSQWEPVLKSMQVRSSTWVAAGQVGEALRRAAAGRG